MKKTVFEGIVNGKKFNDVDAYNAAVKEILDKKGNLKCSSSTYTIDDIDEYNSSIDYLIGADTSSVNKELEEYSSKVLDYEYKSIGDFDDMINTCDRCISKTTNNKKKIDAAIQKANDDIQRLQDKLDVLEQDGTNAEAIINSQSDLKNKLIKKRDAFPQPLEKKDTPKSQTITSDDLWKDWNMTTSLDDFFNF